MCPGVLDSLKLSAMSLCCMFEKTMTPPLGSWCKDFMEMCMLRLMMNLFVCVCDAFVSVSARKSVLCDVSFFMSASLGPPRRRNSPLIPPTLWVAMSNEGRE